MQLEDSDEEAWRPGEHEMQADSAAVEEFEKEPGGHSMGIPLGQMFPKGQATSETETQEEKGNEEEG